MPLSRPSVWSCLAATPLRIALPQRASEAPSRSAQRYMEHLEDILKIQDYLIETSAAHGIPVITTTSVESLTSEVAMVVSEQLQEQERNPQGPACLSQEARGQLTRCVAG